ncbi:glycosyl hydrolase family 95 catalytic domain-containing protein [Pseudactinotalea sp. Z1748]|uniref:glycosyl hydrolase family 95 catalytic domain-containing protein n=1 Tax=Pseudactinotalea sp. Z1748 TaxID=3413027 RepID=UPI003C7D7EC8
MRRIAYRRASTGWLDALPLGNGRVGAMVFGEDDGVRLQLTEGTGWSGSPASEHRDGRIDTAAAVTARQEAHHLFDAGQVVAAEEVLRRVQSRQPQALLPFGDVELRHRTGDVTRILDLADAVHTASVGAVKHESFVSAPDNVMVHHLISKSPVDVTVRGSTLLRILDISADAYGLEILTALPEDYDRTPTDEGMIRWTGAGVTPVRGALSLRWEHDGITAVSPDEQTAAEIDVKLLGVRRLVLVAAIETTFDQIGAPTRGSLERAAECARARAHRALRVGHSSLRERHVSEHRALFDRAGLRLTATDMITDPDQLLAAHGNGADPVMLEALFDYGRYLLIASSRPGGLPATLQGLWNGSLEPPWSSAYTININTEMNYWLAGPTNLPEAAEPLMNLVEALAKRGRETAQRLYGARGWVAHHNTDAWAFSTPTSGDASWAQWPMGGVWLVCELDRLRGYGTCPATWADRLWPLAIGAAEFVLDLLQSGQDGWRHTFPSTSPENRYHTPDGPASVSVGTGMDRTLITELFAVVQGLAAVTGNTDHPALPEVHAASEWIHPPIIDDDGTVREWHAGAVAIDPHHRHLSHLAFAYPGGTDLDADDGALAAAVDRTLRARGDEATGWSLAWKLALRARLRQADSFTRLLPLLCRPAGHRSAGLYSNLFAAHPPFQIDGNLGFTAAMCEALLQSHREEIEVLPALPEKLGSGSFHGLVARPGLSVDLTWENGRPISVVLRALNTSAAGPHQLRHGDTVLSVDVPAHSVAGYAWPR